MDEQRFEIDHGVVIVMPTIDETGEQVDRFAYDPFGSIAACTNDGEAWHEVDSASNVITQGGRWDADAGIYSFRHRDYAGEMTPSEVEGRITPG
jgi:hypothetical protein